MKKKSECPHCGASMMEHKHTLSKSLIEALIRLDEAGKPINLKELNLTRNQWDNLQKLRYWGLAEKHYVDGKRKGGWWRVTERGREFLAGKIAVARGVWTYRGEFRRYDGRDVFVRDIHKEYRGRQEYADDAKPALEAKKEYRQVELL